MSAVVQEKVVERETHLQHADDAPVAYALADELRALHLPLRDGGGVGVLRVDGQPFHRIGRTAHGTGAVHGASGIEKRLPVENIFRGILRRRETEFQLFVHSSSLFSSFANIVRAANAFTNASYRGMSTRQLSPWPAPGNV